MKLYPPYIEGTIPAFYSEGTDESLTLTVPFSMNRAVSKSVVSGFYLQFKTIQTNKLLFTLSTTDYNIDSLYEAYFTLTAGQVASLKIGQFYKIQLAYIDKRDSLCGYYSTVGVIKYTSKPTVTISNLSTDAINMHKYTYIGNYEQATSSTSTSTTYDDTEKVYSYRFIIKDKSKNIIEDSGELLHTYENDVDNSYSSSDTWEYKTDLDINTPYTITYIVTTNNKLTVSSPSYTIMQKSSIMPELDAAFTATLNYDNGYVNLKLVGETDEDGKEAAVTGSFLISRASRDTNYTKWEDVLKFTLRGVVPSRDLYKDFTVEQGKYYIYSLQQYNSSGLYSERILTEELFVDFEDAFLYDGTRQLKIKYDPKISSFKTDLLETKVDTIGSQYPFIFRNGRVSYKEFPISGLISYQSDEENLFMDDEDLGFIIKPEDYVRTGTVNEEWETASNEYFFNLQIQDASTYSTYVIESMKEHAADRAAVRTALNTNQYKTTDLNGVNFAAERAFKLSVLDWLNNGEPKLFRSPGEGNYIVRLMNVSYSPNDTLSRMLHTFSATAYEIAECTYENLGAYNIIEVEDVSNIQTVWASLPMITTDFEKYQYDSRYVINNIDTQLYLNTDVNLLNGREAQSVRFEDMIPGDQVKICTKSNPTGEIITIGATGYYEVNIDDVITSVVLLGRNVFKNPFSGTFTYSYYSDDVVNFNTINDIEIDDLPVKQYIGDSAKTISRVVTKDEAAEIEDATIIEIPDCQNHVVVTYETSNIIKQIENVKRELVTFFFLHFYTRNVEHAYYDEETDVFYKDAFKTNTLFDRSKMLIKNVEDPFQLYDFYISYVTLKDKRKLYAYEEVTDLTRRDFDLGTYYTYSGEGNNKDYSFLFVNPYNENTSKPYIATEWDSTKTYYRPSYFKLYLDICNINSKKTILDPNTRNWIRKLMNTANIEWTNEDEFLDYSNKIMINDGILDLSDTHYYGIDTQIELEYVAFDCGIAAEFGYETQNLNYSIESEDVELQNLYNTLEETKDILKEKIVTDDEYSNIIYNKNVEKLQIALNTTLSDEEKELQLQEIEDKYTAIIQEEREILNNARETYKDLYDTYILELAKKKAIVDEGVKLA